jgi:hypothetical protein
VLPPEAVIEDLEFRLAMAHAEIEALADDLQFHMSKHRVELEAVTDEAKRLQRRLKIAEDQMGYEAYLRYKIEIDREGQA